MLIPLGLCFSCNKHVSFHEVHDALPNSSRSYSPALAGFRVVSPSTSSLADGKSGYLRRGEGDECPHMIFLSICFLTSSITNSAFHIPLRMVILNPASFVY